MFFIVLFLLFLRLLFPVENFTLGRWDEFERLKCFVENGFEN